MDFLLLEKNRLQKAHANPNYTRSNESLKIIHGALANYIKEHSNYDIQDANTAEYLFTNSKQMGQKKVDIALLKNSQLQGVIMFKGVCKDYNKNANNYYENMKGESSLFIEDNIPIYQMMWLPSYLPASNKKGWETIGQNHLDNYSNFIKNKSNYWNLLQLDIFIFDIDYKNDYNINYSQNMNVLGCSTTIEEGLEKFIKEVNAHWTK